MKGQPAYGWSASDFLFVLLKSILTRLHKQTKSPSAGFSFNGPCLPLGFDRLCISRNEGGNWWRFLLQKKDGTYVQCRGTCILGMSPGWPTMVGDRILRGCNGRPCPRSLETCTEAKHTSRLRGGSRGSSEKPSSASIWPLPLLKYSTFLVTLQLITCLPPRAGSHI